MKLMQKAIRFFLFCITLLLTIVALIIGGTSLFLESEQGRQLIHTSINSRIPGTIEWDHIDISFLKGSIEVHSAILTDPQKNSIAGFETFYASIDWKDLLRGTITVPLVLLKKPWATIEQNTHGEINIVSALTPSTASSSHDSTTPFPFNVVVKTARISDGSFLFDLGQHKGRFQTEGLAVTAWGNLLEQSAEIDCHVPMLAFQDSSRKINLDTIEIKAAFKKGNLDPLWVCATTTASSVMLRGSVNDIAKIPALDLNFTSFISLCEITNWAKVNVPVTGNAAVKLKIAGVANNPSLSVDLAYDGGMLSSLPVDRLDMKAIMNDRSVSIQSLTVHVASGVFDATGALHLQPVFPQGFLGAEHNWDALAYTLAGKGKEMKLMELFPGRNVPEGALQTSFSLEGMGITPRKLSARASVDLSTDNLRTTAIKTHHDISLHAACSVEKGILTLSELSALSDTAFLSGSGSLRIADGAVKADVEAEAPKLQNLLTCIGSSGIGGNVGFKLTLGGHLSHPSLQLSGWGKSMLYGTHTIGDMTVIADLDTAGTLGINDLAITKGNSSITLSGSIRPFQKGGFHLSDDPWFDLDIHAHSPDLNDFKEDIGGEASLRARITGTVAAAEGDMQLRAHDISTPVQKVTRIDLRGSIHGAVLRADSFSIEVAPGEALTGHGWISRDRTFDLSLASKGISLRNLDIIAKDAPVDGLLSLSIQGNGSLADPRVKGSALFKGLQYKGHRFHDLDLNISLEDRALSLSGLSDYALNGSYHLDTRDFSLSLSGDRMNLAPYFLIAGQSKLSGFLTADIEAKGNISRPKSIHASADIAQIVVSSPEIPRLIESRDISISLSDSRLVLAQSKLRLLNEGEAVITADGMLGGSFTADIQGSIPLKVVESLTDVVTDLGGSLTVSAKITGTISQPAIAADVQIHKAGCTISALSQRVHSVKGRLEWRKQTIIIAGLEGALDSGTFGLEGSIGMDDFRPASFRIALKGYQLPFEVPERMHLVANTTLSLEGTPKKSLLKGELILVEGHYFRDVNIHDVADAIFQKKSLPPEKGGPRERSFLSAVAVDIAVTAKNPFVVDNNIAYLEVHPDLRISGMATSPVLQGRTSVESGTVTYQKRAFNVTRGVIDFLNPYKTEPTIDIAGETSLRDWVITLKISGTPDRLAFRLISDPPEEHGDIISLLILGKTTRELMSSEGVLTAPSMEAIVAHIVNATLGEDIKKATGLDTFEVETAPDEPGQIDEHVKVTIGKELSRRMTVKYSVETEEGEMTQRAIAEYKFLENILLSGFQDNKGVFGGEIHYRIEFR